MKVNYLKNKYKSFLTDFVECIIKKNKNGGKEE